MKKEKETDILNVLADMFERVASTEAYRKQAGRKRKNPKSKNYVEMRVVKKVTIPYGEKD